MWPFIGEFVKNLLKNKIEANVEQMSDYCKGFRFEKIDLGSVVGLIKIIFNHLFHHFKFFFSHYVLAVLNVMMKILLVMK